MNVTSAFLLIKKIEASIDRLKQVTSYLTSIDSKTHLNQQLKAITYLLSELEMLLAVVKKRTSVFGTINIKYLNIYNEMLLNCICNAVSSEL